MRTLLLLVLLSFNTLQSLAQPDVPLTVYWNGREINPDQKGISISLITAVNDSSGLKIDTIKCDGGFPLNFSKNVRARFLWVSYDGFEFKTNVTGIFNIPDSLLDTVDPALYVIYSKSRENFIRHFKDSIGYPSREGILPRWDVITVGNNIESGRRFSRELIRDCNEIVDEKEKSKKWKSYGYRGMWSGEGGIYLVKGDTDTMSTHAILARPDYPIWIGYYKVEGVYLSFQNTTAHAEVHVSEFSGHGDIIDFKAVLTEKEGVYEFSLYDYNNKLVLSGSCDPNWQRIDAESLAAFEINFSKKGFIWR